MKTLCVDLRWIDSSGVGMYIQGIMPGLISQLNDVSIVALGNKSRLKEFSWASAPNMRLVQCNPARYSLTEQIQLPLSIPGDCDLFFSPYYTIPLLFRGRLAVTVHDMSHLVVDEIVSNPRKHLYAKTMYGALTRRADLIFTVSSFSKSELLRLTQITSDVNILPIHLGVESDWYNAPALPPLRTQPYIICVGNVKPYKNLRRLVNAFLAIQDHIPHDLVIVGQSEGLITGESMDFFTSVRENDRRIHLTGYLSRPDLLSLVAHADALIMPSLYEGFGLPPLEAMAAGTPVAVSKAGSLPEICGSAALYFDPLDVNDIAEKLLTVISDENLRSTLTQKGSLHSKAFRWEICSAQTAQALRSVLL